MTAFRLIAYLRVEPEDPQPLTYEQACAEHAQARLLHPENLYRLEPFSDPDPPLARAGAQCGRPLHPVAVLLGPVCGACCRRNHQRLASTNSPP